MARRRTALGQLLQERRERLGLSRTRLGEAAGISAYTIEGWEIGRVAKPPIHDVLRVARALGISSEELEEAVFAEEAPPRSARAAPRPRGQSAVPLLEEAIRRFEWSADDAARELGTAPEQLARWRSGAEMMPLSSFMTLTAIIGLRVAQRVGGDQARIADIAEAAQRTAVQLPPE